MFVFYQIEFLKIYIYIILCILLAIVLLFIGIKLSPKKTDFEKITPYECGFIPIGDARQPFHVRFYLVGVLFLLFDLEVIFLFPWVIYIQSILHSWFILINVIIFVLLLVIGFLYEYIKGALDWE